MVNRFLSIVLRIMRDLRELSNFIILVVDDQGEVSRTVNNNHSVTYHLLQKFEQDILI